MRLALITALLLAPRLAAAAEPELPVWQSLGFIQQSFWVTARSQLDLSTCTEADRWCLEVNNSLADNVESVQLIAEPGGNLIERHRESAGSERRRKQWLYQGEHVLRERLEPSGEGWQVTSRRELPYPKGEGDVTDALMLLAIATPGETRSVVVQGDLNFYRVEISPAGEDLISTSGELGLTPDDREVDLVTLRAQPLLSHENKYDFSLLGLSGEITIAWDRATGLPLQLRGRAPRLGHVAFKLSHFMLRDTAP